MSIKKRCNECDKKYKIEDLFIYKNIPYCINCLYSLVFRLAEDGVIGLYYDESKEKGIIVRK